MRAPLLVIAIALAASGAPGLPGVIACSGDAPPDTGECIGELYQPCAEEHDCDSGLCQNFASDGFQVCSQQCDAATPCPGGAACDEVLGACKPAAPDDCTLE